MNATQLQQQIAALRAENEALKAKAAARLPKPAIKVSEKGAVSVYGLGRFPVTLYAEQWKRLASLMPELQGFIAANQSRLATKQ